MTTLTFNNQEELHIYIKDNYDEANNTVVFQVNDTLCDVVINYDKADFIYLGRLICIKACDIGAGDIRARDINSCDIKACDIKAYDINAWTIDAYDINAGNIKAYDIKAGNINACDINYYAICFARDNITCHSIKGRQKNARHFCLDKKIKIINKK